MWSSHAHNTGDVDESASYELTISAITNATTSVDCSGAHSVPAMFFLKLNYAELDTIIMHLGNTICVNAKKSAKYAHLVGNCLFAARKQFTIFGSVKVTTVNTTLLYNWTEYLRSLKEKGYWFSSKSGDTNLNGDALDLMFFSQLRLVFF